MEILKRFLCDWGSADSNMLLFFMLISFLLGLLAGWLIWGRKIEAMLATLAQKEDSIKDLNAKLTIKETDLNKANTDIDVLRLTNRTHEEEKGQLRVDLYDAKELNIDLMSKLNAAMAVPVSVAAVAASTIDADVDSSIEDNATSIEFDVETPSDLAVEVVVEEISSDLDADNNLQSVENEALSMAVSNDLPLEEVVADETPMLAMQPDNLKIVEGIGPKIEELCNGIDIWTWKQLSETPVERLQEMLDAAGKRYQIHNPTTWAAQAAMAHEGKWDELKVYQDHLKGGKEPEK